MSVYRVGARKIDALVEPENLRAGVMPDSKARRGDRVGQKPPGAAFAVSADDLNDVFKRNFILYALVRLRKALVVDLFIKNWTII